MVLRTEKYLKNLRDYSQNKKNYYFIEGSYIWGELKTLWMEIKVKLFTIELGAKLSLINLLDVDDFQGVFALAIE